MPDELSIVPAGSALEWLTLPCFVGIQDIKSRLLKGIALTIRALVELDKPTLYDLLSLHARARGEMVDSAEGADAAFSVEAGTPFELERIASGFMA